MIRHLGLDILTIRHSGIRYSGNIPSSLTFSSWQFFCHVQCGFVLQSDLYRQRKAVEVDNFFFSRCYKALSSPRFWGESLGTRLADPVHCNIEERSRGEGIAVLRDKLLLDGSKRPLVTFQDRHGDQEGPKLEEGTKYKTLPTVECSIKNTSKPPTIQGVPLLVNTQPQGPLMLGSRPRLKQC